MHRHYRFAVMYVFYIVSPVWGLVWNPSVDQSPSLHTTQMEITIQFKPPLPSKAVIDLECMTENQWRAERPINGQTTFTATFTPEDFTFLSVAKDRLRTALEFYQVKSVHVTTDGKKDDGIAKVDIRFSGNDGKVYPWETDPPPAEIKDGKTYWPGLSRTSGGHFGWRYEPNGLLMNNITFNTLERWWFYFRPSDRGKDCFTLQFGIPGALTPEMKVIEKGDYDQNKAGLVTRREYEVDKGIYAGDNVQADWTSFRWKRNVKTASGKEFSQELRYSILALGVQVETNAPEFEFGYQAYASKAKKAPQGIAVPTAKGLKIIKAGEPFDTQQMVKNWIVLLGQGAPEEIPVLVVFQHRPEKLEFTNTHLVIHRKEGIGTLAFETPCLDGDADREGASLIMVGTLDQWAGQNKKIPIRHLESFANLLTAYPWKSTETFAVADGKVHILDTIEFLPWRDDWNTKPVPYSPLPPLVAYAITHHYIPRDSVTRITDLKIPTKWGPYWARKGTEIDYVLPVPKPWDYFPLKVDRTESNAWLYDVLMRSISRAEIEKNWGGYDKPNTLLPTMYPHCSATDQISGAFHTMNFMPEADKRRMGELNRKSVLNALFPQNYRLRRDPLTGERHLACTSWTRSDYDVNGENDVDIDYWQGLTIYGLYGHAKYNNAWDIMAKSWATIRGMASYWEGLHSWALMSPGAREAGEIFGGDMTAAGYDGMVGFYEMAKRLGTPFQRDLSAYLLALNAIPRAATFGFIDWARKLQHPEIYGTFSAGFGECWVTSIKTLSNDCRDMSAKDPWWGTGPIGPMCAQPELLDLPVKYCLKDAIVWEECFRTQCPDSGFLSQRPENVMAHVMFRMYLSDKMRAQGIAFMKKYVGSQYSPRYVHVLAGMLAWDVPVRLLDWSPASILSGRWDEKTRTATFQIKAEREPATIQLTVKSDHFNILADGKTVEMKQIDHWQDWRVMSFDLQPGIHQVEVKK